MNGGIIMGNLLKFIDKTDVLIGIIAFLVGIILGFIVSPVKNGISIGNKNHTLFTSKRNDDYSDIFSEKEGITF